MHPGTPEETEPKTTAVSSRTRWASLFGHLHTLAGFLSPGQRAMLPLLGLLALLGGYCGSAIPVLLGLLVNALRESQQLGLLAHEWPTIALRYLSLLLGVLVAREALQFIRRYLSQRLRAAVESRLTVDVTRRLLRTDLGFFTTTTTGSLRERMMRAVEACGNLVQLMNQDVVPALFMACSAVIYALRTQLGIGMLLFLAVPSTLLLAAWQARVRRPIRLAVHHIDDKLAGTLGEQLDGLEDIRAANMHHFEIARVAKYVDERRQQEFREQMRAAWFEGLKGLHDWGIQMSVITYALLLNWRGMLEVGYVLTFWYLCFNIITPLRDVYRQLTIAEDSYWRLEDLKALMEQAPDASFMWP